MTAKTVLSPEVAAKFEAARFTALELMPYFATALLRLTPVEAQIETLAVDARWRLYLGREFMLNQNNETLAFGLLHEVGHVIRDHSARFDDLVAPAGKPHGLWNSVGDACINASIADAGVVTPDWVVTHASLNVPVGPVEEDLYALLNQGTPDSGDDSPGESGQNAGDGDGDGDGDSGDPSADGTGSGDGSGDPGDDDGCGSGAGGPKGSYELPDDDSDAPGMDQTAAEITRRQVAYDVQEAASSGRGSVPADVEAWAAGVLAPAQVPWRQVLPSPIRGAIARKAGNADYRRNKVSRRNGTSRIVKPGRVKRRVKVSVVLDTSGSMSTESLVQGASEILGLVRGCEVSPADTAVYLVDAAVAKRIDATEVIRNLRNSTVDVAGRGGTNMVVGIDAAMQDQPDVVVVYTDGYTPWPDAPLDGASLVIVLAAFPGQVGIDVVKDDCPDWASVVVVNID